METFFFENRSTSEMYLHRFGKTERHGMDASMSVREKKSHAEEKGQKKGPGVVT
jgi:superfamily II DNA/RNA helicase